MSSRSTSQPTAENVKGFHVHFDAVGGVAGDMIVAALLDARPDLRDRVWADLAVVLPPEAGAPHLVSGFSAGLRVTRFRLEGDPAPPRHAGASGDYRDMRGRIGSAPLSEGAAEQALAILALIARVEAELHGVPIEEVHFHEIADWDSLADVVAVGSIAAALRGATFSVSDLPRGGGLVKTRHGLLPAPAPATVALLKGFAWRDDAVSGERVTPTGAAALAHLIGPSPTAFPRGRTLGRGHGRGRAGAGRSAECPEGAHARSRGRP